MKTSDIFFALVIIVVGTWSEGLLVAPVQAQTFTEVAASAGVDGSGLGAAWGDYDNDGDLDMYVAGAGPNLLYQNKGDGTFTEVAAIAGATDPGSGVTAVWGDYDNDGDLDLALTNRSGVDIEGVDRLFRNNGDGKFTEVGALVGVDGKGGAVNASWGDYDNDGDLDLYVVDLGPDRLYRNNGDGTFSEIGASVGVNADGRGWGAAWGDYDNDGDLDMYVGHPALLYRNTGDGKFTEVAASAGVDNVGGTAFGPAWGDYDNDGDLDLYVTNDSTEPPNRLYRNNGDGKFTDVAASAGVNSDEGHAVAWGDYDNDGDLDLYVTARGTNLLYQNNGDGTFTEGAASLGVISSEPFGAAAAWADYDNDGDLDLYVTNTDTPDLLYRNEGTANRWLQVKLQGTISNRSAIGARVFAVTGTKRQMWEVEGGMGFCSQNSLAVEFGFGQTTTVDSLIIRWPSGIVQTFTGLETNQRIAIVEENPLITAVEEEGATLPSTFSLSQNYPNPFNPQTTIHYQVPEEAEIRLTILDLAGQEVRVLVQGVQQPGQYSSGWDGMDASGRAVASGVYLYRLEVVGQEVVETKRMALVR